MKTYKVGSIEYNLRQLITVFIFLLWGDFCFSLALGIMPILLPLKLKALGASNLYLGIILGAMPSVIMMVLNPIVSIKSDRFRSSLGRRIPFILAATPGMLLFLILIGCSTDIGSAIYRIAGDSKYLPSENTLSMTPASKVFNPKKCSKSLQIKDLYDFSA